MNETIETHEEKDGGFTLVELLIVIVILGILAAVTVFAVAGITSTAQTNACGVEYKTLLTAQESYEAVEGTPATTFLQIEGYLTESVDTAKWTINATTGVIAGQADCLGTPAA